MTRDEALDAMVTALGAHHPTRGMRVSMGVTCTCGYWSPGGVRATSSDDGLDLHRAKVVAALLAEAPDVARVLGIGADRDQAQAEPQQMECEVCGEQGMCAPREVEPLWCHTDGRCLPVWPAAQAQPKAGERA